MRYAIIESGVVVNVAIADADFAQKMGWILALDAAPGDLYNAETGEFARPESEPE